MNYLLNHRGVFLPSWETHLQGMLDEYPPVNGKPTYQYRKLETALGYAKKGGLAVDVGAHVGLWSMHLCDHYSVVAFEPVAEYRELYKMNVKGDYILHACALGDRLGRGAHYVFDDGHSGCTKTVDGDEYDIRLLDCFGLNGVNLIKIDCEGYEAKVITGGIETIKRNRPVIIVEQKHNKEALPILDGLGMVRKAEDCGDYIYSWD